MVTKKGLKKDPNWPRKLIGRFSRSSGGPHENTIARMAVALKEAGKESFGICLSGGKNARQLASALQKGALIWFSVVMDNHLLC